MVAMTSSRGTGNLGFLLKVPVAIFFFLIVISNLSSKVIAAPRKQLQGNNRQLRQHATTDNGGNVDPKLRSSRRQLLHKAIEGWLNSQEKEDSFSDVARQSSPIVNLAKQQRDRISSMANNSTTIRGGAVVDGEMTASAVTSNSTESTTVSPLTLCGNGVIDTEMGEQCDDGNRVDGDGCSSTCCYEINNIGLFPEDMFYHDPTILPPNNANIKMCQQTLCVSLQYVLHPGMDIIGIDISKGIVGSGLLEIEFLSRMNGEEQGGGGQRQPLLKQQYPRPREYAIIDNNNNDTENVPMIKVGGDGHFTKGHYHGCIDHVDKHLLNDIHTFPIDYYLEIRTVDFPDGAVRGELYQQF